MAMVDFWDDKKVVVTGGNGFLGQHLVLALNEKGCYPFVPDRNHDLRMPIYIDAILKNQGVDIVIHLAGNVGGIGYNIDRPYTLFYDNLAMGLNLIHRAFLYKVKKFVQIGTVCAYPAFNPLPFNENDLWQGYPEITNAPYGIAKRVLLTQLQAARQELGFNGIYLIPTNLYGPGDEFADYKSHVIPALIKKFTEGKETVTVWGQPDITRDFIYVKDAARAIIKATETYNEKWPINIGSGKETKISDLVTLIAKLTKYKGKIEYDNQKPSGQRRRVLSIIKAEKHLSWQPTVTLKQGLKETIEWYKKEVLNGKD